MTASNAKPIRKQGLSTDAMLGHVIPGIGLSAESATAFGAEIGRDLTAGQDVVDSSCRTVAVLWIAREWAADAIEGFIFGARFERSFLEGKPIFHTVGYAWNSG